MHHARQTATRWNIAGLVASVSLTAALAAGAADDRVQALGAARAAAYGPEAQQISARLVARTAAGDVAALVLEAYAIRASASLTVEAQERLLRETLLSLAQMPATSEAIDLARTLAATEPRVFVWQEDAGHRLAVPLYDVGAAARYALRRWRERDAETQARTQLASGLPVGLDAFRSDGSAAENAAYRRGILAAFASAADSELIAQRDHVAQQLTVEPAVAPLAAVVARRLGDSRLAHAVVAPGDDRTVLSLVGSLRAWLTPDDALDLLVATTRREHAASAATFEIAALIGELQEARTFLFAALADPALGGSAAAALAKRHDPAIAADLRHWCLAQKDPRAASRAVLALRLDGSPAARAELARIVADPAASADLREAAAQ